jgi:hypothetical protein
MLMQNVNIFASLLIMATKASIKRLSVRSLTQEQARKFFDRQAKKYLGIRGAKFNRRWDAGEFNGSSDTTAVMRIAMLLPFGR